VLFDCLTCDKCLPVCPNDANFTFVIPEGRFPLEQLHATPDGWVSESAGELTIGKPRQIGNFADACNECGNCDVFCPEDGGPHIAKPRFFGDVEIWKATPQRDGFAFVMDGETLRMHGRFDGEEMLLEKGRGSTIRFAGKDFDIRLDLAAPVESVEGYAEGVVDLGRLRMMEMIRAGVTDPQANNFISAALLLDVERSCRL